MVSFFLKKKKCLFIQQHRDAWKKLEGMTRLKAMHSYVEALLKVATEVRNKLASIENQIRKYSSNEDRLTKGTWVETKHKK